MSVTAARNTPVEGLNLLGIREHARWDMANGVAHGPLCEELQGRYSCDPETRLTYPRSSVIIYEEYHPFGTSAYRAVDSTIEVSPKRYRYAAAERDEETGLDHMGLRYYAPWLGRWTSADPIGLGDGVNRHAYLHGNPVGSVDLTGTRETWRIDEVGDRVHSPVEDSGALHTRALLEGAYVDKNVVSHSDWVGHSGKVSLREDEIGHLRIAEVVAVEETKVLGKIEQRALQGGDVDEAIKQIIDLNLTTDEVADYLAEIYDVQTQHGSQGEPQCRWSTAGHVETQFEAAIQLRLDNRERFYELANQRRHR
jgi:RHS repeat-associated protein